MFTRYIPGSSLAFWLAILCGVMLLCASTEVAAQPKDPLRMSLINVASSGGDQPKKQLERLLAENDSIKIIETEVLRRAMSDFAVNEKILRKGDLREKFKERIARMLKSENIEGLLVIDSYSKGRKLQIVVLGPEGAELKDIKRNIKGGRIDQDTGIGILKDVFPALGPDVLSYRERMGQLEKEDPDPDSDPDPDPDPDVTIGTEDPKEPRAPGTFAQGGSVSAGIYLGQRSMEVEETRSSPPDAIRHKTPLVGVGVGVDGVVLPVGDAADSALTFSGFFAYAPFKTEFKTVGADGSSSSELFTSSFVRVGGQLHYRRFFTPTTIGGLYGGGEYISLRIMANENYTGNIYGMVRTGAELGISFAPESFLFVHGGLLPVLKADNSGGALGESPTSLGYEAGALILFRLTDAVFARLGYTFEYLSPTYPEPTGSAKIDSEAASKDRIHSGGLLLGFSF